jgi:hypothetical protein
MVRWRCTSLALLWLAACGGRQPSEEEVSAVFERIQVGEARIAVAAHRARDAELGCDDRRGATDDGCAAAEGVCEDAGSLEDADAARRCEDARRKCTELRGEVARACQGGPS